MTALRRLVEPRERQQFQRGDVVRIAPGGLPMRVVDFITMGAHGNVLVEWKSGFTTYRGTFESWRLEKL